MRWKFLCVLLVLPVLLYGLCASADQGAVAGIQRQYETITTFQAEFTQELQAAVSRETEERQGRIFYQSPDLIRWETTHPEKELLIVGPTEVWNYFEEEETAYRYAPDDVLGSAMILRILSGQARLDDDFLTEEDLEADSSWRKIRLVPRSPEPNLVEALIWVEDETFLLQRVRAVDFYGNVNEITLHNLDLNLALDPDLFTYTPPPGVLVQDNL